MLFWMLLQEGKVALGVPITDGEEVGQLAYHDRSSILMMRSV
jgi:hypothetical protein